MNKVVIAGRLTRNPETRYSQSSEPLAIVRMSVAVNRRFKKDGEPSADFINCVAFGKTGEFISKYFNKGKMIGIVGRIHTNSWTDNNGQKRYSTEVLIEETEFLESKSSSESYSDNENYAGNEPSKPNNEPIKNSEDFYSVEDGVDDDNLPF